MGPPLCVITTMGPPLLCHYHHGASIVCHYHHGASIAVSLPPWGVHCCVITTMGPPLCVITTMGSLLLCHPPLTTCSLSLLAHHQHEASRVLLSQCTSVQCNMMSWMVSATELCVVLMFCVWVFCMCECGVCTCVYVCVCVCVQKHDRSSDGLPGHVLYSSRHAQTMTVNQQQRATFTPSKLDDGLVLAETHLLYVICIGVHLIMVWHTFYHIG